MINEIAMGKKLRLLREKANISLRELARKIKVSAPFLSDVELGRRYPSEEILAKISKELDIELDELKKYDTRSAVNDLKRLAEASPNLGYAFRSMVDHVNAGTLSTEEVAAKLKALFSQNGH